MIITRVSIAHDRMHKTTLIFRNSYAYPGANPHGEIMPTTEEYLIETADRCARLAREGRSLLERLEAISHELMAKAVELDTERDKNQQVADKSAP